jgi:S-formylglutathione hydrolase FrmB
MKNIVSIVACLFFVLVSNAARVDTVVVYSNAMHKNIKVAVVIPDNAKGQTGVKFPVVYLLHGYSGNYGSWLKDAPQLQLRADQYQVMLVCPDGGYGSWYYDSPINDSIKYETFITKELLPYIDSNFPTSTSKDHRAITGLSMGGHGGLFLGIRHSNLFGNAGSVCGGVDIRPFPNNWDIKKSLGTITDEPQNWDNYSVINIAKNLKPGQLHIIFDCGVSDFFIDVNRSLHQLLLASKIDHDYTERPGGHNKAYWSNSIDYQLQYFAKSFLAAIK